ncbi:MAG TPA: class D sortase [Bryobacteraceae bacterium]|nr:class D sortase [Bryobacteraceae bacterium]
MLRWLQYGLLALALVLLGAFAREKVTTYIFQRHADAAIAAKRARTSAHPAKTAEPRLARGDLVGLIDVDRLGISVAIVEGADAGDLRHAAGHVIGTAFPGQPGNVAIAAHRDTFFRPLRKIQPNDLIRLITPQGEFQYRVAWTRVVMPTDVAVLRPDGGQELTLITCYPFYYVGAAPKRFIVRAQRVPDLPESAGMQPDAAGKHL